MILCFLYYHEIGVKVGLQILLKRQRTDNMSAAESRNYGKSKSVAKSIGFDEYSNAKNLGK